MYTDMSYDSDFGYNNPMNNNLFNQNMDSNEQLENIQYEQNQQYGNRQIRYKENCLINIDEQRLIALGFSSMEIGILKDAVNMYGYISNQKLSYPPFCITDPIEISRLMYAYNISMGKVIVDTNDIYSISKHMKKLQSIQGINRGFSCFSIKHKEFNSIPRVAVIAGIPEGNFYCLNSCLYDTLDRSYRVDSIAKEWVTIYSYRKMGVGPEDRLNKSFENREWGIPDILKVVGVGSYENNKPWILKIKKQYCRLCNRFMIVVTTRKQNTDYLDNNGGYEIVLDNGSIVYVYAITTDIDNYGNPKDTVPNTTDNFTVTDYGFYSFQIDSKLHNTIDLIQKNNRIVYINKIQNTSKFELIPKIKIQDTDECSEGSDNGGID